jgi:hypothetical protein
MATVSNLPSHGDGCSFQSIKTNNNYEGTNNNYEGRNIIST